MGDRVSESIELLAGTDSYPHRIEFKVPEAGPALERGERIRLNLDAGSFAHLCRQFVDSRDQVTERVPPYVVHVKTIYDDYEPLGDQDTEAYNEGWAFTKRGDAHEAETALSLEIEKFPEDVRRYISVDIPLIPEDTFTVKALTTDPEPQQILAKMRLIWFVYFQSYGSALDDHYWEKLTPEDWTHMLAMATRHPGVYKDDIDAIKKWLNDASDDEKELPPDDFQASQGYWAEYPGYPSAAWRAEVDAGDTRHSYWDWVQDQWAEEDDRSQPRRPGR